MREEVSDRERAAELTQERDRRKDELRQQFTPSVEATLAMVEGFVYRILQGEVECTSQRDGQSLRFVTAYEWVRWAAMGRCICSAGNVAKMSRTRSRYAKPAILSAQNMPLDAAILDV